MRIKIKCLLAALLISAKQALAIIIVPPLVYMATFSVGAYLFNVFMMTAVYMASRGIADRFYFKRPVHEIIGQIFSYVGSVLAIIATSFVSIAIFDPLETRSLFYASLFSAFFGFLVIGLNNFRRYNVVDGSGRKDILRSIVTFSIFVFTITFVSAYLSINTEIIKRESEIITQQPYADATMRESDSDYGLYFAPREKSSGEIEKNLEVAKGISVARALWFNPYKTGICEIYDGNTLIKSEKVSGKCFFYDSRGDMKRIACPINIRAEELNIAKYLYSGYVSFEGRGACVEKYDVKVSKEGFTIK